MKCRKHCGACCIAPSIELSMPNMPNGKPAGVMCANLDPTSMSCLIWGRDKYPIHCHQFVATADVCGDSRAEALQLIADMQIATDPD